MKPNMQLAALATGIAIAALAGCGSRDGAATDAATGVRQTGFPGQLTAGGSTSGAVMARSARPATDGTYAGGTPGMAGGSGGNTGGAATAGTVQESGKGPTRGVTPPTSSAGPSGAGAAQGSGAIPAAGATPPGKPGADSR